MAYKLQLKRGASGSLPTGSAGEPLFTTDTNDLYIGTGAFNQRYQKYIASGTSSQFLKGDGSLDSNTYYLASNPSAYIALTALTASAPLSYNNTTGAFTISQASGSVNGFLSSTDWTTFNNKQNTITNPVTGTGTANYITKWAGGSALGSSVIYDNGTNVGVGNATPQVQLSVTSSGNNYGLFIGPDAGNTTGKRLKIGYYGTANYSVIQSIQDGVTATNLVLQPDGGNVLINSTTDNGNRLQVTGDASFTGTVTAGGRILSGTRAFIEQNGSGDADMGALAGGNLTLFNRGLSVLLFNASGQAIFNTNLGNGVIIQSGGLSVTGAATFSSSVTATSFIKSGGTSSQYLMADGSVTTGGGGSVDELQVALLSQVYG